MRLNNGWHKTFAARNPAKVHKSNVLMLENMLNFYKPKTMCTMNGGSS